MIMRRALLLMVAAAMLCACRQAPPAQSDSANAAAPAASSPPPTAPLPKRTATTSRPRIVFLGDSLTAGLGLPADQSYPALIQQRLDNSGYSYEVVNAGVSGDTSAGGLRRLDWSLEGDVRVLVVALGGNDALRGLAPAELEKNLASILDRAAARKLTVILAGMEAPPNNGPEYTAAFRAVYSTLARRYHVRLIPFLLDGVAGQAALNQADGIHPNARGANLVADLVWRELEPVLARGTASQ
jgi:acyl-CoA thioesterase-1